MRRPASLSLLRVLAVAAAGAALAQPPPPPPQWVSCCNLTANPLCLNLTSVTFSPAQPRAGDTMVANATGTIGGVVQDGVQSVGTVAGTLNTAPFMRDKIKTCGQTVINVLDLCKITLNLLPCPTQTGEAVATSMVVPIPQEAQGLGNFVFSANASDQQGQMAFCFHLTMTL